MGLPNSRDDGTFERVGGHEEPRTNVRVIASTHRDLAAMVRLGRFREDLWYRIHVFAIRLPPLRQRRADIADLAAYFAGRAGRRLGSEKLAVTPADLLLLQGYDWPGNVRELAAVMDRAAILGGGVRLEIVRALGGDTVTPRAVAEEDSFPTLDDAIREHIERALVRARGKIEGAAGAARLLGLHANTLRSRMEKLGVQWERFRPAI